MYNTKRKKLSLSLFYIMTDPITTSTTQATQDPVTLIVPEETKAKFPDLVKMILESRSMNNQERNYWLQVLPVMTPEQVSELRNILETEVKKLAEIDSKYGTKPAPVQLTNDDVKRLEEEKRQKRLALKQAEEEAKKAQNPDDILAQLG